VVQAQYTQMDQSREIYYQARKDLTINDLPIFFGQVKLQNGKVSGKHYRARIDQLERIYLIGYRYPDKFFPHLLGRD